jgi:hypothetical protein
MIARQQFFHFCHDMVCITSFALTQWLKRKKLKHQIILIVGAPYQQ